MNTFTEKLEQQHEHHESYYHKKLKDSSLASWIKPGNGDYWGNMLPMVPLAEPFKVIGSRSILTLGDGKGGKEAVFFKQLGHIVTASDVATSILEHVKNRGLIDNYLKINAENIELQDESFDFVVTKETLHHLPRPYLAIYEMLRVARQGIVFVEPKIPANIGPQPPVEYEESGNFVYRFSAYELTQLARAYGVKEVAYGYGRMFHQKGSGEITGVQLAELQKRVEADHRSWDQEYGREYRSMLICIMLKENASNRFKESLKRGNFDFYSLDNPTSRGG